MAGIAGRWRRSCAEAMAFMPHQRERAAVGIERDSSISSHTPDTDTSETLDDDRRSPGGKKHTHTKRARWRERMIDRERDDDHGRALSGHVEEYSTVERKMQNAT